MSKKTIHQCTKETEIALLSQSQDNVEKKINDIHKSIVGNGRPGLKADMDMAKGAIKFLQIMLSVVIVVFTIISVVK